MNIILDAKSRTYKQTTNSVKHKSVDKIFGFAIKLSILEKYGISITSILKETNQEIIIDAEYNRLDHWLIDQLTLGSIQSKDLNRLLITVQAKRIDAENQLINLSKLDVSIVLVTGHKDYLKANEETRSGVKLVSKYYQKYSNIRYLGISALLHDKLNTLLNYRIQDNIVLELYGDHKLTESSLWVYWVGTEISDEARNYINRRRQNGEKVSFLKVMELYCIQNKSQLESYNVSRSIYVYLDVVNQVNLLNSMKEITK